MLKRAIPSPEACASPKRMRRLRNGKGAIVSVQATRAPRTQAR